MGKKTYTYRTTTFVVGSFILLFLLLLSLSFLAGYYVGESTGNQTCLQKREPSRIKMGPKPTELPSKRQSSPAEPESSAKISSQAETYSPRKNPASPEENRPSSSTIYHVKSPPAADGNYLLQVAAFRNPFAARKLSRALQERGFPSKIQSARGFYRVLVGPYTLDEARNKRREIFPILKELRVRLKTPEQILIRRKK